MHTTSYVKFLSSLSVDQDSVAKGVFSLTVKMVVVYGYFEHLLTQRISNSIGGSNIFFLKQLKDLVNVCCRIEDREVGSTF